MLTEPKKKVLDFIRAYTEKHGVSPTLHEIRKGLRKRSVSSIHQHLEELRRAGYVRKEGKRHRSIELARRERLVDIPLMGTITGGKTIAPAKAPRETVAVARDDIGRSEGAYALRVRGDGMLGEGASDGDIVVVKTIRNPGGGGPADTPGRRKKLFLERIKSANPQSQNKYKRVALSPIRYAGGKTLAVGHVLELLPDDVTRVVSPFFGGGSIEIAMSKELGLEVVGYDIFDILCNYWKFQIEQPDVLYGELKKLKPNKTTFEKIRLVLNDVWKKKVTLDPLTLAVYYVYNFNLSYGPGFMGWSSKIYLDQKRYARMLQNIRDFEPKKLRVECGDFRDVITKHPKDFLYCDPPYYIGEDSKMFRGIYPMRNIPVHHKGFPHEALRDLLRKHKGGFILSYNNCPTTREYYKEFQQFFPSWQYTMGQGETRIGLNRKNGTGRHVKESHEVIIYSPPRR